MLGPEIYIHLFVVAFGLIVGSFLNVCIYRLPRGISIVRPGSFCPGCGRPIKPIDNIPLLSYIMLKGKCRYCGAHISLRYPLVEGLYASICEGLYLKFGLSPLLPVYLAFLGALVVVSFIDIDLRLIPDQISLPGIRLGFALSFFVPGMPRWRDSLIGVVLGGGLLIAVIYGYEFLTAKRIEHRVEKGEDLSSICEKYRKKGYEILETDVLKWNRLAGEVRLKPGQKVTLPVKRELVGGRVTAAILRLLGFGWLVEKEEEYRVKKGDTVEKLAQRFGTRKKIIEELNCLPTTACVREGQKLRISLSKAAMGGGDVKLLAMIGSFAGWQGVLFTIFVGSILGTIFGLISMLVSGADRTYKIPFGPFLSAAAALFVFFGKGLVEWYLGILS